MRNGYKIGADKLSQKEFSDKYWLGGDAEYQFHSMDIKDGLDERQQLLINNDRALYKMVKNFFRRQFSDDSKINNRVKEDEKAIEHLSILQILTFGIIILQFLLSILKRRK